MAVSKCDCGRAKPSNRDVCQRCKKRRPPVPPEPSERNLNACTVCGYEAANRGLLKIHVDNEHGDGGE